MNPRPIAYKAIALPLSYRGLKLVVDQRIVVPTDALPLKTLMLSFLSLVVVSRAHLASAGLVFDVIVNRKVPDASVLVEEVVGVSDFLQHLLPLLAWRKVALSVSVVVDLAGVFFLQEASNVVLVGVRSTHLASFSQ